MVYHQGCSGAGRREAELSILTADAAGSALPIDVSASLGFASAGFILGVCGYALSLRTAKTHDLEWEVEESPSEPREVSTSTASDEPQPTAPRSRKRRASILRMIPLLTVTVCALVGASLASPSYVWLPLFAVGLLGLSLIHVVSNQERRLAALERRFRGEREP